jgi:N-acetylglucosamine transport system permease protein
MKQVSRRVFIAAFLAPSVLLYALFLVWPLLQAFNDSRFQLSGVSANRTEVGLRNFETLFRSDAFWQALRNSGWVLVVAGLLLVALGVGVAHLLHHSGRFARFLRGVFLFPQVVSLVAVAIIWKFLYNPSFGLIGTTVELAIQDVAAAGLLGTRATALPSVTAAFVWWALGFYVMLFLAGLRSVPSEVNEAAELDGAQGWRRFRLVTWPMLWSVKRVAVAYVVINVVNLFALVFLMTRGGDPDRATEVVLTYLYELGFENGTFGLASAQAVVVFVLTMALTALVLFWFRRDPEGARA